MSLKQSSLDPAQAAAEQSPGCWHRDRNRSCLRIEASPTETFLFPYSQFVAAHHARSDDSETLLISFSSHEVTVAGQRLGDIAAALQDLSVNWVKTLPARYRSLTQFDGAVVTQIEVKPVE